MQTPISRATDAKRQRYAADGNCGRDRRGGFSMLEVVLALLVLGLLATLALPFARSRESVTALRAKAFEVTTLLRTERNAARQTGAPTVVTIDATSRVLQAQRSAALIRLPPSMTLGIEPSTSNAVFFLPDGKASGGIVSLKSGTTRIRIGINTATAGISILDRDDATR